MLEWLFGKRPSPTPNTDTTDPGIFSDEEIREIERECARLAGNEGVLVPGASREEYVSWLAEATAASRATRQRARSARAREGAVNRLQAHFVAEDRAIPQVEAREARLAEKEEWIRRWAAGEEVAIRATIVAQPEDIVVFDGDTGIFSVAADGMPPLAYQWQAQPRGCGWANIPGATAPEYETDPVASADDGTKVRVIVRGHGVVVRSAIVTLTVTV